MEARFCQATGFVTGWHGSCRVSVAKDGPSEALELGSPGDKNVRYLAGLHLKHKEGV